MLPISVPPIQNSIEVAFLHKHVLGRIIRAEDHESFQARSGRHPVFQQIVRRSRNSASATRERIVLNCSAVMTCSGDPLTASRSTRPDSR